MKNRIPVFITFVSALSLSISSVEAQRRGTGASSVSPTPAATPTEAERTSAAIQDAEERTLDQVDEMDSEATAAQQAEIEQAQENLQLKTDATDAEIAAGAESPVEPMSAAPGIDDLSSDLPPIEDELPELSPDELPDPSTLIPDDVYVPEPSVSDSSVDFPADAPLDYDYTSELPPAPPEVKENEFEKERKLKVRFQQVKLQALKDQAIREMKDKSERAKTDEDKRQALREYYRMLFAKINSIDPELVERSDVLEKAYLRRLGQYRVEPTIPLNPPPTPEPLENL